MATKSRNMWEKCNFKQEDACLQKIFKKRKKPTAEVPEVQGAYNLALTKYLNQQPDFVKSVVVLIDMWTVSSIPAAERLRTVENLDYITKLIGIQSAQMETAAAKQDNCEPSLMRALIRCLQTFSTDLNAVSSLELKLQEMKSRSEVALDPANPKLLETSEGQESLSLLQGLAALYLEYIGDVKSGLWPETVNDMCENFMDGRIHKVVPRKDGKAYVMLPRPPKPCLLCTKLGILVVVVLIIGLLYRIYD